MSLVSEGVRVPSALCRPLAAQPGDGVASRKLHCLGLLFQPRTVVPLYRRLLRGPVPNELLRAGALRRNIEMAKHEIAKVGAKESTTRGRSTVEGDKASDLAEQSARRAEVGSSAKRPRSRLVGTLGQSGAARAPPRRPRPRLAARVRCGPCHFDCPAMSAPCPCIAPWPDR
jgi:hypothetical protein